MYNEEMKESMKKVAAHREANAVLEPRRMTADEKDKLLATYHPDYKQDQFATLQIGPNKGEKVPLELADLLQAHSRIKTKDINPSIQKGRNTFHVVTSINSCADDIPFFAVKQFIRVLFVACCIFSKNKILKIAVFV